MDNSDRKATVALPWYEEEDFSRLCQLSGAAGRPPSYSSWRLKAKHRLLQFLAAGQAVELVRIDSGAYVDWLGPRRNTGVMRRRYVALVAAGALSA